MTEQLSDKYKIPETLRPLLEALARETIRAQPTDVVSFGKLFFDILSLHQQDSDKSILTDNISYDMFRMDLQHRYKNMTMKENMIRSASPEDVAATKIQAAFRGHQVRMHPEKYGVDAELIRRRSSDKLASLDFKKDQKRHSIGGYSLEHSQTPEDRAATKIQAEFRGYITRKNIQAMREQNDNAATKIQAHVRGFLTRKRLGKEGLISPSRSHSSLQSHKSEEI
ncbi:Dimerization-anchoring domain of cAMP-dependent protein kinase, regulatory subunit and Myosin-like IQ motif-containing domain and P-loop containing nucleoside triphosphate hydrolase domain-containing protein [Strongyloides ratti]|uniref:Dimerization-anchoring domain of cAMP-dependent protein kinase, regulatory subunit and Myosin-like IQ motif-containing domain and P-loop containing nucleoside triphosphate hydrolase... n=1 Tax=Strongyloides ratti TaxID=34506 RepID=A0A090LNR8_STRRB|nr:Dimerization-anchoring domain of cAMP-dependent protein kinase, regulatory subunit and Myosin-like IQ motif-containing domain and P-loop containing nucleoside triphosphate hydrolase domain-containing protein [Strongyloides ratti]CEF71406.1 Dimerization-anchoring domain of cAMP-dependent protein kinase, regulatory subunit and Myosin-like IQ motif-containing domain and P-loop containing nucleoside triphosphate hydrolase domain-containing protein [Strongyloides ratti]